MAFRGLIKNNSNQAFFIKIKEIKSILIIAGSDSCGGAGMQADIRTLTSLGFHPLSVLTALTAQNSMGINDIYPIPSAFVLKQLETIITDIPVQAVKVGMLFSIANIKEIANFIKSHKLPHVVLDPILSASTGISLLEYKAIPVLKEILLPFANVVTPNIHEAAILAGTRIRNQKDMFQAAKLIKEMGPDVVITGGHLGKEPIDIVYDGNNFQQISGSRLDTPHTHGSGCVFSSALAAFLSQKNDLIKAAELAHDFVRHAIKQGYPCGSGSGPVHAGWKQDSISDGS